MMVDSERDRRLDALADHLDDGQVGDQGSPEIAVQELVHPGDELHDQGLIEAKRGADALQPFRRGVVAGENRGGVTGGQAQQQEDEQRDHAHHGDGGQNSAKQISEQV
jgi:hypothetical protein